MAAKNPRWPPKYAKIRYVGCCLKYIVQTIFKLNILCVGKSDYDTRL